MSKNKTQKKKLPEIDIRFTGSAVGAVLTGALLWLAIHVTTNGAAMCSEQDMAKKLQMELIREHNKSGQRAVHIKYLTTGALPAEYFNDTMQRMSQKVK